MVVSFCTGASVADVVGTVDEGVDMVVVVEDGDEEGVVEEGAVEGRGVVEVTVF